MEKTCSGIEILSVLGYFQSQCLRHTSSKSADFWELHKIIQITSGELNYDVTLFLLKLFNAEVVEKNAPADKYDLSLQNSLNLT